MPEVLRVLHVPVLLCVDSEFVVRGLTRLLPSWKFKGWRMGGGGVQHMDLWVEIAGLLNNNRDVQVLHVWSHVGVPGNETVDEVVGIQALIWLSIAVGVRLQIVC